MCLNLNAKMKYYLFLILILSSLFSCKNKSDQEDQKPLEVNLEVNNASEEQPENYQMEITPRFMTLVRHADSMGYLFDTLRYTPHKPYKTIKVDHYIFFEIDKKATVPFLPIWDEELSTNLDIKPLEKVQKVVTYYFRKKEPDINSGAKWYPDGLVEEWTFENKSDAMKATQELINAEIGILYFNTGAFVCGTDRQMYVFYSRAMAFMYRPQKDFYHWFVEQNEITLCNKTHYY